ncbi:MAG: hypothetical protein R3264_08680 [Anaerolineae bacterium]|nr:hypothetical protein [Anaerolineae bacterium]
MKIIEFPDFSLGSIVNLLDMWLIISYLPIILYSVSDEMALDDCNDDDDTATGGYIELYVAEAPDQAWAVVQWLDTGGRWRDVEAWQGKLSSEGGQKWWVSVNDFGRGPYRWVVTQDQHGPVLAVTGSFQLPTRPNEVVYREISLAPSGH